MTRTRAKVILAVSLAAAIISTIGIVKNWMSTEKCIVGFLIGATGSVIFLSQPPRKKR